MIKCSEPNLTGGFPTPSRFTLRGGETYYARYSFRQSVVRAGLDHTLSVATVCRMISPAGAGGREVCVEKYYTGILGRIGSQSISIVRSSSSPTAIRTVITSSGSRLFDLLGPFDQTEIPGVEIFFVAEVVSLFEPVDPVEIEVIDILPFAGRILIDDGESGTCHCVVGSEPGDDFPDQGGFARPISPRKTTTERPSSAFMTAAAACGNSSRESMWMVCMIYCLGFSTM